MSEDKNKGIGRRRFLARLGAATGLVAASGCSTRWAPPEKDPFGRARNKPYVPGAEAWSTGEERWTTSTCGQCSAGCGIRVRVVEGRAVRVEGDPQSPINRGGIGPRGIASLQALYDPDRLPGPRIRRDGVLRPASWDEALAEVVSSLKGLRDGGRAHQLLIMSGRERGMMNDLLHRFASSFGTPNVVDGRPGHSAVIAQAAERAFGSFEVPAYDWAGASTVVSLEAGLFEDSCQVAYLARLASEHRSGRAGSRPRLIHLGATFDLNAHNADRWIRIRPGTAGAFALGICRELLRSDLYDRAAIEHQTTGIETFVGTIESFTPARVAELTGAAPEDVERVALELWKSRPSFSFVDERSVAYSNGFDTAMASFALNTLLGAVESPSGGLRLAPAVPLRPWPDARIDAVAKTGLEKERVDGAGSEAYPQARSVHETLVEAMDGGKVAAALLYYSNPAYSRLQPKRWREALAKVPLLVSFSPYLDETVAELAHVVLPDHTALERYDDAPPAPGIARAALGIRKPVVRPLHDTRSTGDVVIDLARQLGGDVAQSFPWPSFRAAMNERLLGILDLGRGSIRAKSERGFLDELYEKASWADGAEPSPRAIRFELQASWKDPEWAGEPDAYPLELVVFRPLGHADGSGANLPWMHVLRSHPGAKAWEHAALAHPSSAPGIADGDHVTVESPFGKVTLRLRLDERMSTNTVAIALGRGHTAFGRFAKGEGINALELVAPGAAKGTGASVLCGTRVRVRKGGSDA